MKTAGERAWAYELRATARLAWPLVLTNVAQTAFTATGVLMMGHLGSRALAAGTLGANVFFAVLMFGVGRMSAAAPMIAQELGNAVVTLTGLLGPVRLPGNQHVSGGEKERNRR